jgi:hypothetical protein
MANPKSTTKLDLEKELSKILEALNKSSNKLKFEVISCYAASTNDLQDEFRKYQPQIVHFSGHGAGEEGLVFEDETKHLQLANTKALAGLFKLFEGIVECVILNACYSDVQADEIHRYVNCVIGMKQTIGDNAAIEFASGFYKSLSFGDSFERAYEFGRNAIEFANYSESLIPILKIKNRDAGLSPKLISELDPKPTLDADSSGKSSINADIQMRGDNSGSIVIGSSNTVTTKPNSL